MALQTLKTIRSWFRTGFKPTQTQFWDTWDSFRHKEEKVPVGDVDGIDELLLLKADKTVLDNHLADKNAHAPQVNTDWNSKSGFSQLINKPEFRTINGRSIIGNGEITIKSNADLLWEAGTAENSVQAKGGDSIASGVFSVATGFNSKAEGNASHAEGDGAVARGYASHAEGRYPEAIGFASHAEGANALAEGTASHAEGNNNQAKGDCSHAEGYSTIAKGDYSHAQGQGTRANGQGSHAQGHATIAEGEGSHAGGAYSSANGAYSFVHGQNSKANGINTVVLGKDIVGEEANTTYVAKLNIKTIPSGTVDRSLGVDSAGNVVVDNSGGEIPTIQAVLTSGNNVEDKSLIFTSVSNGTRNVLVQATSVIAQEQDAYSALTSDGLGVVMGNRNSHFVTNNAGGKVSSYVLGSGNSKGVTLNLNVDPDNLINYKLTGNRVSGDYDLTTTSDFKTINGESIIGTGDIIIEGGSQNLQQTLDNGSIAQYDSTTSIVALAAGDEPNNRQSLIQSGNGNQISALSIINENISLYGEDRVGNTQGIFRINQTRPEIQYVTSTNSNLKSTLVSFDTPAVTSFLNYPAKKLSGTYTLATTDDISLQNIVDANITATKNSGNSSVDILKGEGESVSSRTTIRSSASYNVFSSHEMGKNYHNITNRSDAKEASIEMDSGLLTINQTNSTDRSKITAIKFMPPTGSNIISFPAPKGNDGSYVLATTSDFKTINGESIIGVGNISIGGDDVLHTTGNESKHGDLDITGDLTISNMDTFPRPPETNIILSKNGDLTATNFIGRSIVSHTGEFYSNVKIGTSAGSGSKLEVNGTISSNGIKIGVANAESSDITFVNTPVGSQRTIAGNTIQIAGATGDYFLEIFRYNASDYGMQRITFTSTASAGRFFIRTLTAGVWSAWIEK